MQNVCKKGQISQDYFSPEFQFFLKSYGSSKSDNFIKEVKQAYFRK